MVSVEVYDARKAKRRVIVTTKQNKPTMHTSSNLIPLRLRLLPELRV